MAPAPEASAIATEPPAVEARPSIDPLAQPAPPRLTPAALAGGVRDGTLDGFLVYADATLVDGCDSAGGCTARLAVHGLGLEVVPGAPALGSRPPVPDRALLVLAVRGERLEYLGALIVHPDGSPALSRLPLPSTSGIEADAARPAQTLFDAAGWLVLGPPCVGQDQATPEDAVPDGVPVCGYLAEDWPLPGGVPTSEGGQAVALSPALWGVDPAGDVVVPGPFLVRVADRGSGHAWEVVARYDPSRSVRVVIP